MRRIVGALLGAFMLFSCTTTSTSSSGAQGFVLGKYDDAQWFVGINMEEHHFYVLTPDEIVGHAFFGNAVLLNGNNRRRILQINLQKKKDLPIDFSTCSTEQEVLLRYQDYERNYQADANGITIAQQETFIGNDQGNTFNYWNFSIERTDGGLNHCVAYTTIINGTFYSIILNCMDNSSIEELHEYMRRIALSLTVQDSVVNQETFNSLGSRLFSES